MSLGARITRTLDRAGPVVLGTWAVVGAFTTYFCMYAFRKPFAAATYEDFDPFLGVDYKTLLVITQVIGYAASKFLGIKVISEMTPARRALTLLTIIGLSELSLLAFALVPAPWNFVFLFFNGLPLGMVWGITFGFLEGRRISEPLGIGLSASYIVASGWTKWAGVELLDAGVPTLWMPFVTGLAFLPLLLAGVGMLALLPPPSAQDEAERTKRVPMDADARRSFLRAFLPGLVPLIVLYFVLTAYRDFRDNFAVEIWNGLGFEQSPEKLATTENWIAFGVMLALALLMVIRSNRVALMAVHAVMAAGAALVGVATAAFQAGLLGPENWMLAVGLGAYLAYVPYGCILFDRMIAALGVAATTGFVIYVSDAVGYLGSVLLQLYKSFGHADLSWVEFFAAFSYATSTICTGCFLLSALYFERATRPEAVARRAAAA